MKAPEGYALFRTSVTPDEAAVIAEILDSVGITTFVPGLALNDDFASMKPLTTSRFTEVWVPEKENSRAETALADAKAAADDLESQSDTLAGS